MSLKISEQSPYSITIEKEGEKYSGFLTLSNQKRDVPGLIAEKNGTVPWEIKGIIEHNRKKYVYGPYFKGKFLADIIENITTEDVKRLADVLAQMPEGYMAAGLHSCGIIFGKNSVLVLPGFITESYLKLSDTEKRLNDFDWINSAGSSGFDISYSLAILSYLAITGKKPFPFTSRSDLFQRMSDRKIIAPEIVRHGLKKDISDFIVSVLSGTAVKKPDCSDWNAALESWIKDGLYREIGDEEKTALERKKQKLESSISKGYRLKYFARKHKTFLILSAAVFMLGVYGISSAVKKSLEIPYTINMTPEQVVNDFFDNYNNLDHVKMEGAVKGRTAKDIIDPAVNMTVILKTQQVYGGDFPVVPASQMLEFGLQPSQYGKSVWGVTGLKVNQLGDLKYKAEYTRWFSYSEDSENMEIPKYYYEGFREDAIITLEKKSKKTKLFSSAKVEYYLITGFDITEKGTEKYVP